MMETLLKMVLIISSSAGRHFHNQLINKPNNSKSKSNALNIIAKMNAAHMKLK